MTTIDNATIMAKGQTALDNERKAEERKAAAKAAKAAYVNGKTTLDILKALPWPTLMGTLNIPLMCARLICWIKRTSGIHWAMADR